MSGNEENLTILQTPPKRACSTESKKRGPDREKVMKSLPFNMDNTEDSLGILSFNEISSIHPDFEVPTKDTSDFNNTDDLMKQAQELLETNRKKSENVLMKYKTHNDSYKSRASTFRQNSIESTVYEMDLLRGEKSANTYDRDRLSLPTINKSLTHEMEQISDKIKNTDMSIKDIFAKYLSTSGASQNNLELDSDMFLPSDLAMEKLVADELSWKKTYDLPVSKRESEFSSSLISNGEKVSFGEFFRGKSDECSSIFHKSSPERGKPVPLVDATTNNSLNVGLDDVSLATLSQIQNVIASEEATPTKLLGIIENYKKSISSFSQNSLASFNKTSHTDHSKKPEANLSSSTNFSSKNTSKNLGSKNTSTNLSSKSTLTNSRSLNCVSQMSMKSSNGENVTRSLNNISESDKENAHRNTMDKSLASIRSASSMDSLPNGKLPIECTKGELTWGCVKVGKVATQEFVVRNRYGHRTRFQISSSNPNYKISNIDSDPLPTTVVLLHPMESRKFTISFTPANIGGHTGKLIFYPIIKGEPQKNHRQVLKMHGYGGHSGIDIQNISKDSNGKFWLSLGHIDNKSTIKQTFTIKNNGTLPGFAWLSVVSKTVCSFTNVEIHPSHVVLKPSQQIKIAVCYTPSKQDYKHITTNFNCGLEVFEIAQIKAISGSEVIRGRLRRLSQRLRDENLQVENVLQQISKPFEGECMPSDLKYFKESFEAAKELRYHLSCRDISLTVEQDPEKTLVPGLDGMESSLFQTLSNSQSNFTVMGSSNNKTIIDCFVAEPSTIILTPPSKLSDSILFTSESKVSLEFEIKLEPEGVIDVSCRDGVIHAGETKMLKVTCGKKQSKGKQVVRVLILIDNEVLVVDVKVIFNLKL